jgi:hypothetical protein
MKKFNLKTVLLTLPIILAAVVMELLLRQIPNDYSQKKEYLDSNSKKIEILVLGSSHAFYGVNPAHFPNNGFNAGYVAQTLEYDLEILKKYETEWANLKILILPISYFSLFGDLERRAKNYNIYYGMNTSYSLTDNTETLSNELKTNLRRIFSYHIKGKNTIRSSTLGWGKRSVSVTKDLIKTGKINAQRQSKDFNSLNDNISTLRSIVEFCKEKNIKVFLFTPPAFESYRNNLNEEQLKITVQTSTEIANSFDNCVYVNLLEDESFNAKDFYDADHLNEAGAEKLSLLISKMIENNMSKTTEIYLND